MLNKKKVILIHLMHMQHGNINVALERVCVMALSYPFVYYLDEFHRCLLHLCVSLNEQSSVGSKTWIWIIVVTSSSSCRTFTSFIYRNIIRLKKRYWVCFISESVCEQMPRIANTSIHKVTNTLIYSDKLNMLGKKVVLLQIMMMIIVIMIIMIITIIIIIIIIIIITKITKIIVMMLEYLITLYFIVRFKQLTKESTDSSTFSK